MVERLIDRVPQRPGVPTEELPYPGGETAADKNVLATAFKFRTYPYRENLFAEFERLIQEGKVFDGLIIDITQIGFTLPLEIFVEFSSYGKRLLKPQGVLLFVKTDGALTLTRDDPAGGLNFAVYDSPFGIFARYPMLADYACATVSGIDRRRLRGGGSTLANHILYTSTLVMTDKGQRLRDSFEIPAPQNWVLQLIDDYTSVESVMRTLEKKHSLPSDETLRILQELEAESVIYPIFPRIQFLSNCYHNRKPFRLGRYMVAAGLLSASQLQELLEIQQEEGWGRNQKIFLGMLAVKHGYINTRELEVLLNDQYLYGGYHKVAEDGETSGPKTVNVDTVKDSMIGSLGAIDAAGLLQTLCTAKKTGVLTVENRDRLFMVSFTGGKPTHAKLGNLRGHNALVEFLVLWSEGIFVFRDKSSASELDAACTLDRPLDRILLDGALYQDQINQILAGLPAGRNTILERVWNFDELWRDVSSNPLKLVDDTAVSASHKEVIGSLAGIIDGLSTLDEVVRSFDSWPSHLVIKSVQLLLDNGLLTIQQTSLFRPLTVFQRIAADLGTTLGKESNKALLDASLHYVHGNSDAAQRFDVDFDGHISVDLSQVKKSGTPVSAVLLELRRWMESYLAHCRRQLDPHVVNNVVAKVVHGSWN